MAFGAPCARRRGGFRSHPFPSAFRAQGGGVDSGRTLPRRSWVRGSSISSASSVSSNVRGRDGGGATLYRILRTITADIQQISIVEFGGIRAFPGGGQGQGRQGQTAPFGPSGEGLLSFSVIRDPIVYFVLHSNFIYSMIYAV